MRITVIENIALYDLDGTLADFQGEMTKELLKIQSPHDPEIDFNRFHDDAAPDWLKNRMTLIKNYPGWWLKLPKLVDGFQVYEATTEIGFTPHILTKGPSLAPNGWTEKLIWCQNNIPQIEVDGKQRYVSTTITMDKGLTYGKVLVEDWPPYIKLWLKWRKRGLAVILDRPYNKDFEHPQVVRYDGTPESLEIVKERLQTAYNRK